MTRITESQTKDLMEAYRAVHTQQELTEDQVWEEVENWVNSLVEEGYDLSDYTWEEMYGVYISEAPLPSGNFQQTRSTGRASSETRNLYRSSSDGKVYRNYNDALAAKNSRDRAIRTASANQKMFVAGGGNAAIPQSARRNTRGGGQTIDPAAIERVRQQGFQNIMRQRQQQAQAAATTPPRPSGSTPPARPAAPAPVATGTPPKPTASTSSTPTPTATPTATPTRPSLRSGIEDLQKMRAASLQRQGRTLDAATVSASTRPAYQANSFDPFDVVIGHLLDEGYADTEEAALKIMANMSEEWRQSIFESIDLHEKLRKGTKGKISFTTGKDSNYNQAMTETNPRTGRQRGTSPELKAMGAHGRARAAQYDAENRGDTEAARGHERRRNTIAHVVYNKTGRIIDRADND